MFKGLLSWLGLDDARRVVGFRPHRRVDVAEPVGAVYERVMEAMTTTLGANVRDADRAGGTVDADFGTIGGERLRVTISAVDGGTSRVDIEARYPAGTRPRERSAAVEALAGVLASGP